MESTVGKRSWHGRACPSSSLGVRIFTVTLAFVAIGATVAGAKPKIRFSTFLGSPLLDNADGVAVDASGRTFVGATTPNAAQFAGGATPLSAGGGASDIVITRLSKKGKVEEMVSFGGSDFDACLSIALGPDPTSLGARLVYVLGATFSSDFPTRDAIQEECGDGGGGQCPGNLTITVLDSDLSEILFSTHLGGTGGIVGFRDFAGDLAVDALGRIAVASGSVSKDFPTRRPTQKKGKGATNAVVAILEPKGGGGYRLAFSTYLGGKSKKGESQATSVAFAGTDRLVVVGSTDDRRFTSVAALQDGIGGDIDGFVTVYDLDGGSVATSNRLARVGDPEIVHSTTYGGRDFDQFTDVVVDDDWAYMTGSTRSPDFPAANAFQAAFQGVGDAVLAVLDLGPVIASGAPPDVIVSTHFGGRHFDSGSALAVDRNGRVHLTGVTFSRSLPTRSPVQKQCANHPSASPDCWDAFVARFEPIRAGAPPELRFSTFLGGPQVGSMAGGEVSTDVAVDKTGASYVVGRTNSPGYPTKKPAQKKFRGVIEAMVTKIKK